MSWQYEEEVYLIDPDRYDEEFDEAPEEHTVWELYEEWANEERRCAHSKKIKI